MVLTSKRLGGGDEQLYSGNFDVFEWSTCFILSISPMHYTTRLEFPWNTSRKVGEFHSLMSVIFLICSLSSFSFFIL